MQKKKQRPFQGNGFTLIEVIIVVLIIALVSAIAFPKMDFLVPEYTLKYGAQKVVDLISLARSQSVYRFQTVYLYYQKSTGALGLFIPVPTPLPSGGSLTVSTPSSSSDEWTYQKYMADELPAKIHFKSIILQGEEKTGETSSTSPDTLYIQVSPLGEISPSYNIVLEDDKGRTATVQIQDLGTDIQVAVNNKTE